MSPASERFVNRELSWLEFNRRVLEEAQDATVPLLERVKFLAIVSSNLDEFFMVRVAGLKRRIRAADDEVGPDGLTPSQAIAARTRRLSEDQHRCFLDQLKPLLAAEGVHLLGGAELNEEQQAFLASYFRRTLLPVVTPLAIDPGHPFPHVGNRTLCLVVALGSITPSPLPSTKLSVIHIPAHVLPRFVQLPAAEGQYAFVLLEDVIRRYLAGLYPGYDIRSCHAIRVIRDADFQLARGREVDLLTSIESGLRDRRMGDAVRLQYDHDLPTDILTMLVDELELTPDDLELTPDDLYDGEGFIAFADLFQLYSSVDRPRLKERPLPAHPVPAFQSAPDIWSAMRAGDILVNHPYQRHRPVTGSTAYCLPCRRECGCPLDRATRCWRAA